MRTDVLAAMLGMKCTVETMTTDDSQADIQFSETFPSVFAYEPRAASFEMAPRPLDLEHLPYCTAAQRHVDAKLKTQQASQEVELVWRE